MRTRLPPDHREFCFARLWTPFGPFIAERWLKVAVDFTPRNRQYQGVRRGATVESRAGACASSVAPRRGKAVTKGARVCDPQQLGDSERLGNEFRRLEPLTLLRLTEPRSGPRVCDSLRLRQPEPLSND